MKKIIKLLFGENLTEWCLSFMMGLLVLVLLFLTARGIVMIGKAMGFLGWHVIIAFGIIIVVCLVIIMIGRFVFRISDFWDDEF